MFPEENKTKKKLSSCSVEIISSRFSISPGQCGSYATNYKSQSCCSDANSYYTICIDTTNICNSL